MERKFKIVNKSKDQVKIRVGKEVVAYSWDEFNANFTIEDGTTAVMKEESCKKMDEVNSLVDDAVSDYVISNMTTKQELKLAYISLAGQKIQRIAELLDVSLMQATTLVKKRYTQMALNDKPTEYNRHNHRPKKAKEEVKNATPSATNSLSDVKGADKLKDLFK